MLNCIAIDDEPLALNQVVDYIHQTPILRLIGQFNSPINALETITNSPIDLVFLDIEMPLINGIDFIKILPNPTNVIFTTAHKKYGYEGFKLKVSGYLLKPFSYDEFLDLVMQVNNVSGKATQYTPDFETYLFVKIGESITKVYVKEIMVIEAFGDFCKIYISNQDKPLLASVRFNRIYEKLKIYQNFCRIHRSYVIAINKISSIHKDRIQVGNLKYLPVSDGYKKGFENLINKYYV